MNESQQIIISNLQEEHNVGVFKLYKNVAALTGGIARQAHEVTASYVSEFISHTIKRGTGLVAHKGTQVVGEIHAYAPEPGCFAHVLSNLTIAVDPGCQGQGVGRQLFEHLLQEVNLNLPHIQRVELIVRESNLRAIAFYQSLGFVKEGKFSARIKNADGSYDADIPMAWLKD